MNLRTISKYTLNQKKYSHEAYIDIPEHSIGRRVTDMYLDTSFNMGNLLL